MSDNPMDDLSQVFTKIGAGAVKLGENAKDAAEKAFAGVKNFSENVVQHSTNFSTGAKLNADLSSKKSELNDAYNKLGRLAYQKGGLTGEMQEISDQIHEIYQELQKIELELNEN